MKIVQVYEIEGQIQATVSFPDGFTQSVNLPSWATKQNIRDEAKRLRKDADDKAASKKLRADLED